MWKRVLNYLIVFYISGLENLLCKKNPHVFNKIEIYVRLKKYKKACYSRNSGYSLYLHDGQNVFQSSIHLSIQYILGYHMLWALGSQLHPWVIVSAPPLGKTCIKQAHTSIWKLQMVRDALSDGEGTGTPLHYSCLENPMDGGAWWAVVHGVAKSRTWLSDFTFTFHFRALEKEMATHSSVLAWRIPGMGEPGGLPSMG